MHRPCPHQECSWKGKEEYIADHLNKNHYGQLPTPKKKITKEEVLDAREKEIAMQNEILLEGNESKFIELSYLGEWISDPISGYQQLLDEIGSTEKGT